MKPEQGIARLNRSQFEKPMLGGNRYATWSFE